MRVTPEEYLDQKHLVDGICFKISTFSSVAETKQVFAEDDDFRLRRPDPVIKVRAVVSGHSGIDI